MSYLRPLEVCPFAKKKKELDCFVKNNKIASLLSIIVHLILIGLTESKSLLFLLGLLLSAIPFVSDRNEVDLS